MLRLPGRGAVERPRAAAVAPTSLRSTRALCRLPASRPGRASEHFRLSYVKVVEFQRRGLVHLHVVVRADGAEGPEIHPRPGSMSKPSRRLSPKLSDRPACRRSAARPVRCGWGTQVDLRDLGTDDDAAAVASYTAKYATKCADGDGALAHPVRSERGITALDIDEHRRRLVRTAWQFGLDPAYRDLRLRAHAHTFGYPGHFATKSVRYSTTFGALRGARAAFMKEEGYEPIPVDAGWRYRGRGYQHPDSQRLAEAFVKARSGLDQSSTDR